MPFPSPPWNLRPQLWLSLFAVRDSGRPDRPAALYGAAFVDYRQGGVLAYHELLVARPVRRGSALRIRITDIWVDSVASRDGGRTLWAIPKELADLTLTSTGATGSRPEQSTWRAAGIASATFAAPPAGPRLPFLATASQVRGDGSAVDTRMSGSARPTPCRASWDFDATGPLAWLHDRSPVASFRLRDARLTFGG